MQLSRSKSIRNTVAALTTALLGTSLAAAPSPNKIESSMLLYSETDRVSAAEVIATYSKMLKRGWSLSGTATYDALTGASPNGATPSRGIQTFTRPSGSGGYTAQPGETPLDDTFHDTRFGLSGSATKQLDRNTIVELGARFSAEYDYFSGGVSAGISRDLNQRNTTLSLSGSYSHDVISPEGGIPNPFTSMLAYAGEGEDDEGEVEIEADDDDHGTRLEDNDSKDVLDVVFGLTQVLGRKMVARFNYSFNHTSGYLTDPFKILSVLEPPGSADAGEPVDYRYEKRPDSRTKHALYGQILRYLGGNTIDLSYRYFWDDWGVNSHTVDAFYRQQLGRGNSLQPHIRWYRQTEADFYRLYLLDGSPLPQYASADSRLAAFDAYTVGLQYALPIGQDSHITFTGEYYTQQGDSSPPEAFGTLRGLDLFPKMDALMFRIGLSHGF
jgi:hypothetical protein